MSTCEGVDPPVLEDHHGPLPHNKTLFLGYAFLLTMATPSDKLANCLKPSDGPAGSSEEEEGEVNLTHCIFQVECCGCRKRAGCSLVGHL